MRVGLSLTDFHTPYPAEDLFAKVESMGYVSVQLAFAAIEEAHFKGSAEFEFPDGIPDEVLFAVKCAAEKHHIKITAVNGTWNMTHPDKAVREAGLVRFAHFARDLKKLGSPIVTLCSGSRNRDGMWRFSSESHTEEAWADMVESMRGAAAIAEEYDLTLALETEASNVVDTVEKAGRLLREVDSPRLKMILDGANLFHAGEANREIMRPRLKEAMDTFGDAVVLAHGKDIAEKEGIAFCATGKGIVDFPYMLSMLRDRGNDCDMILHGIYREEDMAPCCEYMKTILHSLNME